jgi:ankyrin repeat protein
MRSLPRYLALALIIGSAAQAQEITIHDAARDGDNVALRRLLAAGADPNAEIAGGWTPLMFAAMGGNTEGALALLDAGADPNAGEAEQGPPLSVAAMTPFLPPGNELAIVKLLTERGARVEILNGAGMTPLMYAAREGNVERAAYLLRLGADVNHRDARRWTPLRFAAGSGSAQLVHVLLAHGATPNVLDESYRSPLHYAVLARSTEIAVALLDAGADPNLCRPDAGSPTPLLLAASNNDAATIALLCARGASPNYDDRAALAGGDVSRTALDWARLNGNTESEKALKNIGAMTHAELEKSYGELLGAVRTGNLKALAKGLAKEIDPRIPVRSAQGNDVALLDEAAMRGNDAIVAAILATPFAFDGPSLLSAWRAAQQSQQQEIAAMIARKAPERLASTAIAEDEVELVTELLAQHPDIVTARDDVGRTPLHLAVERRSEAVVTMLLERGADIGARDWWKETPLFEAVRGEDTSIAGLLLAHGADLAARNMRGMTPLHAAARAGRVANVRQLLAAGASIDGADDDRWSPMHHAAWANSRATLEALIAAGAKRDLRDRRNKAPLDLARQMNNGDAATLLQQ